MENIRICSMCKEHLPATQEHFFYSPTGKHNLQSVCKPCSDERVKQFRERHKNDENFIVVIEQPKFKRYLNKGLDMVLVYRKNKLSKTMSYPLFLEKYPGSEFETLEVI